MLTRDTLPRNVSEALAIVEETPATPDTLAALVFHADQAWRYLRSRFALRHARRRSR